MRRTVRLSSPGAVIESFPVRRPAPPRGRYAARGPEKRNARTAMAAVSGNICFISMYAYKGIYVLTLSAIQRHGIYTIVIFTLNKAGLRNATGYSNRRKRHPSIC